MSNLPAPSIRQRAEGTFVRFPPQRQWGFVNVERFELCVDRPTPFSHLRHAYAQLNDVKISTSFQDLERLIAQRTLGSEFRELHFESPSHEDESVAAPLMCWGIYQPEGQRPQAFYLEGGFHALTHGLRFELYAGQVFGTGALNAQTLAAKLLREARLPSQQTHPTVLNLDPLTELSIACCLDWGWKLPQRHLSSCLEVTDGELRLLAGESFTSKEREGQSGWRTGVTPQHLNHLRALKRYHEGEALINAREYESALIFYQAHTDDPHGAQRYFELRSWIERESVSSELKSWLSESSLSARAQSQARAIIAEREGQFASAAEYWAQASEGEISDCSPHATSIIQGLIHFTRGMLLKDHEADVAAQSLELARAILGQAPHILSICAEVAILRGDAEYAHERLSEMAEQLTAARRSSEAASTWVQVGDLWLEDSQSRDRAERAYLRALEISPDSAEASCQLSRLYEMRGDIQNARTLLERLLERFPYHEEAAGRLRALDEADQELLTPSETQVAEALLAQSRMKSSARSARSAPHLVSPRVAYSGEISLQDSPPPYPLEDMVGFSTPAQAIGGAHAPPPRPLSAAPEAQSLWSEDAFEPIGESAPERREVSREPVARAARSEGEPRADQGLPRPPRGNTPSPWSPDQLEVINRAIATAHDEPESSLQESDDDHDHDAPVVDEPDHNAPVVDEPEHNAPVVDEPVEVDILPQRGRRIIVERESAQERDEDAQGEADEEETETREELEERLKILKKLAHKKRASTLSQTQACLEVALIYRDQLLDLDQAQEWIWEGLKKSPEGGTLHELTESLVELYTSREDHEGLLSYHQYMIKQKWGDPVESFLQSASLLKAMGRFTDAADACTQGLQSLKMLSGRDQRSRRLDQEKLVQLKAEVLRLDGKPAEASEALFEGIDQVGDVEQRRRKRQAAQLLTEHDPKRSAELYEELYNLDPSESRLDEWLRHVNHWGDPHARAQAVRAYAAEARAERDRARIAPRCLAQLADELQEEAPLLSLELYFESLDDHSDFDVAERAVELAQRHHQHLSLLQAVGALIPECFPGEYRGALKLKRSLALSATHDPRAEGSLHDALIDLAAEVEDLEGLRSIMAWGREVCSPEEIERYLSAFKANGLDL